MDFVRKCREHLGKLIELNVDYIRGGLERHGQSKARGTIGVPADEILRAADCCFVLSTGRCGTGMLTRILSKSRELWPLHEPSPRVIYVSSQAYHKRDADPEILKFAALSARYDLVAAGYVRGRILVDTHPGMSYFSRALSQVFSKSKFIHLVRHPGDYARSVLGRKYYTEKCYTEGFLLDRLLVPAADDPVSRQWPRMSRIEKVAWLWNELQRFAEAFKPEVEEDRVLTVRCEDLFEKAETTHSVFEFLGVRQPLSAARVARLLRRPVNAQKTGNVPPYVQWPESDKASLRRWATQASTYGYDLR